MGNITQNKFTDELVHSFNEEMITELAKRFKDNNYSTPFNCLKDWLSLRVLAITSPELRTNYIYLLNQQQFDEN